MADSEHVSLARAGASAISRWREATWRRPNTELPRFSLGYRLEDRGAGETFTPDYLYGRPSLDLSGAMLNAVKLSGADLSHDDLSRADLTGSDLRQADLSGANLQGAHLWRSNLARANFNEAFMAGCTLGRTNLSNSVMQAADLKGANIAFSNLSYVDLERADLSGTDLSQTDLSWANLSGANLRNARLIGANLDMADLSGADLQGAVIINAKMSSTSLSRAICGLTTISNCDLTGVIGLGEIKHAGPSMIGLDTISRSKGQVDARFLEGAGVPQLLVEAQDALRNSMATYKRVLLVGSVNDGDFADKIKTALAEAQVPSWVISADDEESLTSGSTNLDSAVYYDRVILLCTVASLENPLTSRNFSSLVSNPGPTVRDSIITVATDDMFFQREDRLCAGLREGKVVDFRGWDDEVRFKESLSSLIREFEDSPFSF
ncbi:MAG: hypothetical protein CL902_11980 [Dehalococcoidia bacterium]|nr:hypothetical protein [Dehalococcoidia bacterium]